MAPLVPAHVGFEKLNCRLLGLSIDSTYSHIAWLRTIKEKIEYKGMKNVEVMFHQRPEEACGTAKERVETPAKDTKVLDWFMTLKKMPQRPAA